jgi:hypothetical protein
MSSFGRLSELVSVVSENTKKLEEYLASQNHPQPSLEPDSPLTLDLPEEITAYQETALDVVTELRALLLGPIGVLQYQAEVTGPTILLSLRQKIVDKFYLL